MSQRLFLSLISLAFITHLFSQTGPAGVGTSATNVLWLKADQNVFKDVGVTLSADGDIARQWNDASGNIKHASEPGAGQQAQFKTNILNGLPVLRFDGNNDRITSTAISTGNQATVYAVTQFFSLGSPNPGVVQGSPTGLAYSGTATDKAIGLWINSANNNVWGRGVQTNGTQCNISQTTALATNTFYILNSRYNGATINQYVNSAAAGNVAYNGTLKSWTDFGIGRQATETIDGDIAEVIVFNSSINDAQRIMIDNYLSSKYNIALAANDKYVGDTPGNGDYDFGVAGIGQSAGASQTNFSSSVTAGVGLTSTGGVADGDFILAGYNNVNNWEDNADVGGMTGANPARWLRDWYFDVTNGGANITGNLVFDLSDGGVGVVGLGAAATYVLLYRAGTAGNWTEVVNGTSVAGDQISFNGVTLTNDGYYTIGTHDKTAGSLPIELKTFYALPQSNSVLLHWETATETNNKEYTLYKSKDGSTFEAISSVPSKANRGNSLIALTYDYVDTKPTAGTSYYRLKQTDYNGKSESFQMISVNFTDTRNITFTVYPNPNQGEFTVDFTGIENNHEIEVLMHDQNGKLVFSKTILSESLATNTFPIIPDEDIAAGVYMVNFVVEGIKYPIKVLVQ